MLKENKNNLNDLNNIMILCKHDVSLLNLLEVNKFPEKYPDFRRFQKYLEEMREQQNMVAVAVNGGGCSGGGSGTDDQDFLRALNMYLAKMIKKDPAFIKIFNLFLEKNIKEHNLPNDRFVFLYFLLFFMFLTHHGKSFGVNVFNLGFLNDIINKNEEISENNNQVKEIFNFENMQINAIEYGVVLSVGDGIVYCSGLDHVGVGSIVSVFCEHNFSFWSGLVLNLEKNRVAIVLLDTDRFIRPGDFVFQNDQQNDVSIGVSFELLGRVINTLGDPIDGLGKFSDTEQYPIEIKAPGIIARSSVNEPLQTGIKAIDSMIPVGRGQRELIIGDRQTGKTTVAINTILMQSIENIALVSENVFEDLNTFINQVFCIYVGISQRRALMVNLHKLLQKYEALNTSILISATSSESAALQYLAPYAACTIGEYFRDNFMHSLIIYDDLSKHAVSYRQISLLLRRPPSREAYPGDVFYLHSRLLERAAKLSEVCGSGSLTALPIIETQKGDVSAYIPTNVISITDGQIFLETDLFYNGIRPAVSVGLSVSRVGSAAQNLILKKVSSSLRFDLAQYRTVAVLQALSSDLDPTTQFQLLRGSRLVEILKQSMFRPLLVEQQIFILYAVMNGFFDNCPIKNLLNLEQKLLSLYTSLDLSLIHFINLQIIDFDFFSFFLDNFFKKNIND